MSTENRACDRQDQTEVNRMLVPRRFSRPYFGPTSRRAIQLFLVSYNVWDSYKRVKRRLSGTTIKMSTVRTSLTRLLGIFN